MTLVASGVPSGAGVSFADVAAGGSLPLAAGVALLAGLVSFVSPCMLPLVPGYLSYVTGLSAADVVDRGAGPRRVRGRLLAGSTLFVLGFTAVFVTTGALFGGLGALLLSHALTIQRVLGVVVVLMGVGFLGLVPWLRRQARPRWMPRGGLAGAPLLGAVFGVGWTPCIGPTLAAVLSLAATQASAGRGAALSGVYSLGLGLPFIASAAGLGWALRSFAAIRRHTPLVMRLGGFLLIVTGLLLVSGLWNALMVQIRGWVSGVSLPI